jgi:hypothetical protein
MSSSVPSAKGFRKIEDAAIDSFDFEPIFRISILFSKLVPVPC